MNYEQSRLERGVAALTMFSVAPSLGFFMTALTNLLQKPPPNRPPKEQSDTPFRARTAQFSNSSAYPCQTVWCNSTALPWLLATAPRARAQPRPGSGPGSLHSRRGSQGALPKPRRQSYLGTAMPGFGCAAGWPNTEEDHQIRAEISSWDLDCLTSLLSRPDQ